MNTSVTKKKEEKEKDKTFCLLHGPFNTVSGYGAHARDIARAIIKKYPDWDIRLFDCPWGNTPRNYLMKWRDDDLINRLLHDGKLPRKPEIYIPVLIPPEFNPIGKFNIGITAGIETTLCHHSWLEGINRMNLNIVPSKHAKDVFEKSNYSKRNKGNNEVIGQLKSEKSIEVLFEGVDTEMFHKTDMISKEVADCMDQVEESFAFLFVGHWLDGAFTHDRKDIGGLIETFINTFKNKQVKPALVLKTSGATFSIIDRENIMEKIKQIRHDDTMPNIYLIHGDMSDKDINGLYNHPKIKAMISLTHGEGYGRPLAEFAACGKPIIATNWSGHIDFLHPNYSVLISGELRNVHKSAAREGMILENSQWFYANYAKVKEALLDVYKNYGKHKKKAVKQADIINKHYTLDAMADKLFEMFEKYLPVFPKEIQLALPKLKKVE